MLMKCFSRQQLIKFFKRQDNCNNDGDEIIRDTIPFPYTIITYTSVKKNRYVIKIAFNSMSIQRRLDNLHYDQMLPITKGNKSLSEDNNISVHQHAIKSTSITATPDAQYYHLKYIQSFAKIRRAKFSLLHIFENNPNDVNCLCSYKTIVNKLTGNRFMCKYFNKLTTTAETIKAIRNEANISIQIDSPYYMKLLSVWEDNNDIYMVYDHTTNGSLLSWLNTSPAVMKNVTTRRLAAKFITYQLLCAINSLHSNLIYCRNLKLENIIIREFSIIEIDDQTIEVPIIMLSDFTVAMFVSHLGINAHAIATDLHYCAPEMLTKFYNEKVDIWTIGVIAYRLLTLTPLFYGSEASIIESILNINTIKFNENVSIQYDDNEFLNKILIKDYTKRPTARDLLSCNWLASVNKYRETKSLKFYSAINTKLSSLKDKFGHCIDMDLIEIIFRFLVIQILPERYIDNSLKSLFFYLDEDNANVISIAKLEKFIFETLENATQNFTQKVISAMNPFNLSNLSYYLFISMLLDYNLFVPTEFVLDIFILLNTSKSGILSFEELKRVLPCQLLNNLFVKFNTVALKSYSFNELIGIIYQQY